MLQTPLGSIEMVNDLIEEHATDRRRGSDEKTLFNHLPDAIVIADEGGRIQDANRQAEALLGYEKGELLGQTMEKLVPEWFHVDRGGLRTNRLAGSRIWEVVGGLELHAKHKDGRAFPIHIMLSPLPTPDERLTIAVIRDISEKKRLEEDERQAKETLAAVIDASPVAIFCLAPDRRVMVWSRAAQALFGYTAEETVGQPYKLVPPGQMAEFNALYKRAFAGETLRNIQVRRRRKDGSLVDISCAAAPMYSPDGRIRGVAYAFEDMTERIKAQEKLRRLAYYDRLTELPNRISLQNDVDACLKQSASSSPRPISIATFDLDGFKDVNDTLGLSSGDQLLAAVAQRLSKFALGKVQVYRTGGDEFTATIPECGDPRVIAKLVDAMLEQLAKPFEIDGQQVHIGASAGVTIAPVDGSGVEELIGNASLALYEAKSKGRQRHCFYHPGLRARAHARRQLDAELRRAFSDNEFELYFQPQVRLSDGAVVGAEALLRWHHPQRGVIGPGAFIDALAKNAIAGDVGSWILQAACEKAADWHAMGLCLRVGVNLFAAQFDNGALATDVENILAKTALPARNLELEITEDIALDRDEAMIGPLRTLREMDIGLAFDDFGTGYASLSYLTRYPLSRIKLDKSFVRNLPASTENAAIVRSLIVMAQNLGLGVVAEGVETTDQTTFLAAEGCEEVQGFLYAKPLPAPDFEAFVRAQHGAERIHGML